MKVNKLVMAFIMVLAILFIPNVYAAEDIEIKSITKAGIGGNATYCENPVANGLTISFDGITFKDKDDFVSYNVVVANNSNEDYEISNGTAFSESKYFKYEFTFEGNSNIVPKKSSKTMNIKISYVKDVDPSAFNDDGTFSEENEMSINLATQPVAPGNPKTGSGLVVALVLIFLAAVAAISMILTNKTKLNKHFIMIIALALAVVPVTIYAAKMVTIKLDTEIIIDKNYHFYFIDEDTDCGGGVLAALDAGTFEASPDITFISKECVNGHYKEKYGYTNPNLTWANILDDLYLEESYLVDVYGEGSTTSVKATDKLIHNNTYTWVLEVG